MAGPSRSREGLSPPDLPEGRILFDDAVFSASDSASDSDDPDYEPGSADHTTDDSDREMPDSAPSGSGGLAASSTRSGRRRQTPTATTALDSDSDDHGEPDSDDSDFESSKKDGGTKKKKKKARGTRGPAKKKGGGQKKKNKKKSGGKRKHARTSAQVREAMEARGCYNDSPRSGRPNPARGILRGEDRAPRMRASRSPCARQATH